MAADAAGTAEIRGAPTRLRRATAPPVEPGRQRMQQRMRMRDALAAPRALPPRIAGPALRAELLDACGPLTARTHQAKPGRPKHQPPPGWPKHRPPPGQSPHQPAAGPAEAPDTAGAAGAADRPGPAQPAPRKPDVLTCVAARAANATAAEQSGLRPEPVNRMGRLRSAMRALHAHPQGEAVVAARRAGPLP